MQDRVLPDLLRLGGALTPLGGKPERPPLIESRTHKALFIEGGRMIGADMVARDVGRAVAHLELRNLIEPMANVRPRRIVAQDVASDAPQDFVEQLRDLIVRIIETTRPSYIVLFVPVQWRLSQALGLSFLGAGDVAPEQWALSEGSAHAFAGFFSDAPAFHFPEVPEDALYVVDLARYVRGETWPLTDAEEVSVRVLTEDEALERARRTDGRDEVGVEEIAMRWREHVFVTVDPGLQLSGDRDDSVVTAVELPAAFGRR